MGFLDKFRKKKEEPPKDIMQDSSAAGNEQPRRVKRYTSDGKPVYD
jgi:hypothetical protein